jgi:hypothetical protein
MAFQVFVDLMKLKQLCGGDSKTHCWWQGFKNLLQIKLNFVPQLIPASASAISRFDFFLMKSLEHKSLIRLGKYTFCTLRPRIFFYNLFMTDTGVLTKRQEIAINSIPSVG